MINRVTHQLDNEFVFPDGSKGWFKLHINPVPVGILILSMDITRNKELEVELNQYRYRLEHVIAERTAECAKSNEKLGQEMQEHRKTKEGLILRATILDNVGEAIFLLNDKGEFEYANEAASKAYGYSVDELLNMNIRSLLPIDDAPSIGSFLKHIVEKGQTSLEMIHLRRNKTSMHVKLYSNLVKTVRGQFIVIVIRESYD
jgi:PAS domain S-box-containing protein